MEASTCIPRRSILERPDTLLACQGNRLGNLRGPDRAADRVGTITLADPRHGGQEIGVCTLKNPEKWKGSSTIVEARFHFPLHTAGPATAICAIGCRPLIPTAGQKAPDREGEHAKAISSWMRLRPVSPIGRGRSSSWRSHPRVGFRRRVRDPYTGSRGGVSKESDPFHEKTGRIGTPFPRRRNRHSILA